MMERRRFLNLVSFGVVGAAAPAAAVAATQTKLPSNFEKDGPICNETLQIQSGTKLKPKPVDNNKFMFYTDSYEEYKQVSMAVGRDGNLWLKSEDGIWKRVVTE